MDPARTAPPAPVYAALVSSLSVVLLLLSGCSSRAEAGTAAAPTALERTTLRYEGATGTVTPAELAEDLGYLDPIRLEYVGNTISGPQNIQEVVTGDIDFGGAFNGAVIKLIAAGAPIQAVIGYYGADEKTFSGYYVKEDSPIHTAKDLLGKKLAVNTVGAHQEFVMKEYLLRNGLTSEDAKQVTMVVIPPVNSEQALRQGQVEVATLSSIFRDAALARGGIRLLFSDVQLYGPFTAGSYVLTKKFIQKNPNTTRKFVQGVAKAIEWERRTPRDQVIARFVSIVQKRRRNENADALKYWQSVSVAGKGGVLSDGEYQRWIDWLVKDGQLPEGRVHASELYTNEFQSPAAK